MNLKEKAIASLSTLFAVIIFGGVVFAVYSHTKNHRGETTRIQVQSQDLKQITAGAKKMFERISDKIGEKNTPTPSVQPPASASVPKSEPKVDPVKRQSPSDHPEAEADTRPVAAPSDNEPKQPYILVPPEVARWKDMAESCLRGESNGSMCHVTINPNTKKLSIRCAGTDQQGVSRKCVSAADKVWQRSK